MTTGSLFSGIGGLELGLEWAGLGPVLWQVEIDPFCRAVLAAHWPNVKRYTDVRAVGVRDLEAVRLICGGFPCQDVSSAGKRAGLDGSRSRLWYEYLRLITELRPGLAVVENVASGKARWLPFVREDLATAGYRTVALELAASDVGAPHRRQRIFVVAYGDGIRRVEASDSAQGIVEEQHGRDAAGRGDHGAMGNATGPGWQERGEVDAAPVTGGTPAERAGALPNADSIPLRVEQQRRPGRRPRVLRDGGQAEPRHGVSAPQPGVGVGADGLPAQLARHRWPALRGQQQHDWEPPRTLEGVAQRPEKLQALGNAVSPVQAEAVGLWIVDHGLAPWAGRGAA